MLYSSLSIVVHETQFCSNVQACGEVGFIHLCINIKVQYCSHSFGLCDKLLIFGLVKTEVTCIIPKLGTPQNDKSFKKGQETEPQHNSFPLSHRWIVGLQSVQFQLLLGTKNVRTSLRTNFQLLLRLSSIVCFFHIFPFFM